MKRWIWDIEVYPNLFLLCAYNPITEQRKYFQVSPLGDNRLAIVNWMKHEVEDMVGFNSIGYDYPVLHYIITKLMRVKGRVFCSKVYKYSKSIIQGKRRYVKKHIRKQIDLFMINHFDNKAKMTSLKLLEFNLQLTNIKELPFDPNTPLELHQIQEVIDYCFNDTDATDLVYQKTLAEIELREKLTPKFNIDFTNFNSTKMGEFILISKIVDRLGEHVVYDTIETDYGARKVVKNTFRDSINLGDVIFDYIQFTTIPFQKILEWLKSRTITETKGVFSKIPFEELRSLEPYYCIQTVTKKQKTLNIVYKGFQYDFGLGGIHGSIAPGIYVADDQYDIVDVDVTSYYPKLAINNRFYPEHIGEEFCDIYESIFKERQTYPKGTSENYALKLALNGSYGKSNLPYSPLYDPEYTMRTTVNGQLLLCMLSERFMEEIPDCTMLQINTDGMTIRIRKEYVEQMKSICRRWENVTNLQLEDVNYSKMVIKDVNNYLAITTDGYVKRKGVAFIYKQKPGELELHKNFSMLVIPKALEAYYVHGTSVEDFVKNHDDVYDFFKRTKINKSDKLLARDYDELGNISFETEIQRITRYFVSGHSEYHKDTKTYSYHGRGKVLIKVMPPLEKKVMKQYHEQLELQPDIDKDLLLAKLRKDNIRENNIEAGYLCTTCNNLGALTDEQIKGRLNYQYYIDEVYKIINLIEPNESLLQLQLPS